MEQRLDWTASTIDQGHAHSYILFHIYPKLGHLKIHKMVAGFAIPACMASVVMYGSNNLLQGLHHTRLQLNDSCEYIHAVSLLPLACMPVMYPVPQQV